MQLSTRTLETRLRHMPNSKTDGGTDGEQSGPPAMREAIVAAAWRCIQTALATQLRDDAQSRDLYASDALFRELHDCITHYTQLLRSMRDDEDAVVTLMLRTLDDAAAPGEPHPALRGAVEEWARQSYRAAE